MSLHPAHSAALLSAMLDAAEAENHPLLDALADIAADLDHVREEGFGDPTAQHTRDAQARVAEQMRRHVQAHFRLPDHMEEELQEACIANKTGTGHHDDQTGHPCTPDLFGEPQAQKKGKGKSQPKSAVRPAAKEKKPTPAPAPKKGKAVRGEMTTARREGAGKEARVVLADGSAAPAHIKSSMVGADWLDVKVATDPEADVLVTARDKSGRAKTVYSDAFHMRQAAAKFARTQEGIRLASEMYDENQRNRDNPELTEHADCVWLMQEQATRPGSESDNKGTSQYFEKPVLRDDVVIDPESKKVAIRIDEQEIPVKDKKTKVELLRRVKDGDPLMDSTFWLKSHGATTLEGRHIVQKGEDVYLEFVGKESVWHSHRVRNPKLAEMLLQRKEQAGDRGKLFDTSYDKVTTYAKSLDGGKFTPKDFRTQKATSLAVETIRKMEVPTGEKAYKAAVKHVGEVVSGVLGNDAVMALASYIDPSVFSVWRME